MSLSWFLFTLSMPAVAAAAKTRLARFGGRYLDCADSLRLGGTMSALKFRLLSLCVAGTIAAALPAAAQHVILDAPGLIEKKTAAAAPPLPARPSVWPRLDPGAVLCRTADDLDRHAANTIARVSGGDTQAADCRIIGQPTGIQIISRQGLGRTEVKPTAAGSETGWTDAWLPDKAPPSR
jgi:hypothetical protein